MRLALTGIDAVEGAQDKWEKFLRDSGVAYVSSGRVDHQYRVGWDMEDFTAWFDSASWTGSQPQGERPKVWI